MPRSPTVRCTLRRHWPTMTLATIHDALDDRVRVKPAASRAWTSAHHSVVGAAFAGSVAANASSVRCCRRPAVGRVTCRTNPAEVPGGRGAQDSPGAGDSPSCAEATHILLLLRGLGLLLGQLPCFTGSGRVDWIAGRRPMLAIATLDCCCTGLAFILSQQSQQVDLPCVSAAVGDSQGQVPAGCGKLKG